MHTNKRSLEAVFVKLASSNKNRFTISSCFAIDKGLKLHVGDHVVNYCFGMCQMTIENETKKAGQYSKIIFVEFIEFLCRILYTKFKSDLESNLLPRGEGEVAASLIEQKLHDPSGSGPSSTMNSNLNSQRVGKPAILPANEEQRKQAHERHLYAFKEFCCRMLEPYFESRGLEFIDPDEDAVLSDSQESDFVYDLPSGYNSQDENNPEYITVLTSGNTSEAEADNNQNHI